MQTDYMQVAINEAFKGMRKGEGGPFGAVVVRKGKIIATAHNLVLKTHDPTSHAEITAIRKASKKLKKFDLSDCEIYSTCEPCPMCLAAIEWARIKILYYGCTREDADKLGFGDKEIYADLKLAPHTKLVNSIAICDEELQAPFKEWMKKPNKKMY